MTSILILVAGLILLVLAGDALVRGSVSAAQRMHIPPMIIGLTIVAFGTSAPELVVSVEAALAGAPGLAVGNVVGSNMANILLVLGLPAIIAPILLVQDGIRRSSVFMVVITALFVFNAMDGQISRLEGLFQFTLLVVYLTYSGIAGSRARKESIACVELEELSDEQVSTPKILVLIGFGIVGLALGGKFTTEGAIDIAHMLSIPDFAIGLTIVALGTSLPELATSIAAALRRQAGVVIGNVIGSNIFNVLGITGITAMIVPLNVSRSVIDFDMWIMLLATSALVVIAFSSRRVNRIEGILMAIGYIVYTIVVFRNGMAS